ncbi:hypothetical protein FUAX_53030 (plasmid) [Fulvitalea axinellae]|uniref:Lipoprotein n=1 Tax=Fulvitalea axinellae TaxID=1182444 RepID=A0AAU9CUY9_9BACT|nr:hypothetical protein FUAX_53030 [Fulvitalea axinellae]
MRGICNHTYGKRALGNVVLWAVLGLLTVSCGKRDTGSREVGRYRFSAKLMESAEKRQRLSLSLEMVNGQDFVASHSNGQDDKQRFLHYLSYAFEKDLYLEAGKEKFPCVFLHFERSFDLSPARRFSLGFSGKNLRGRTAKLVIDSDRFGTGPVKIPLDL